MDDDTTITLLHQPGAVEDPLAEIAGEGARRMLAAALQAEADAFVAQYAEETLPDGRQRVVRHGYGPERSIRTGIGALDVRRPRVRDRAADVPAEKRIRFTSAILPRWARRSKSLDALLPVLHLRGISTGDLQEALAALLGTDAPNLSPNVISRLTGDRQKEYDRWQRRDLSARRYVYIWADGVYLQARMEPQGRVHAGHPRGHARGQEGTRRLPGRHAGERAELAGAADRHQGARACRSPRDRRRRRGHGVLEGARRCSSGDPSTGRIAFPPHSRARAINAAGCTRPPTC